MKGRWLAVLLLVLLAALASSAVGEVIEFEDTAGASGIGFGMTGASDDDVLSLNGLNDGETLDLLQLDDGGLEQGSDELSEIRLSETGSYMPDPVSYCPNGGKDNDALFAEYVDSLFKDKPLSANASIGYQLAGVERAVYRALAPRIAEVAAGRTAKTSLSLPVEELGLEKTSWTFEELHVTKADAAFAMVRNAVSVDLTRLFDAMIADFPYELYWFDKTAKVYYNEPGMHTDYSSVWLEGSFIFHIPVVRDYAGELPYTTDAEKCGAAAIAAARAKDVVMLFSGKGDYEKLDGYREVICDMAAYNDDAAVDTSMPYGNPWQLIWVFDGDPATKVVSEGYAKAFQYLCDMSVFKGDVRCYTVSGYMGKDAIGAGMGPTNHMWNVVAMPNGKNYLADITNCDERTVGYERQLLLVGATSGSYRDGYLVSIKDDHVFYQYSSKSLSLFSENMLSISGKHYLDEVDDPVEQIDIARCDVSIADQVYTGKRIRPKARVSYNDRVLTAGVDYKLTYSKNIKVGQAVAKVKGIGAFTGTRKVSFTINPKGTSLNKLTSTKRKMTVTWRKQTKQVSGYQIEYCKKKSFSGARRITVKSAKKTSRTISGLKSKQRYYVRIRTYCRLNSAYYFSAWSKVKRVKIL